MLKEEACLYCIGIKQECVNKRIYVPYELNGENTEVCIFYIRAKLNHERGLSKKVVFGENV